MTNHASSVIHKRGLHARAVKAFLELQAGDFPSLPGLAQTALALNVNEDDLRAMFKDDRALAVAALEQSLIVLMDDCTRSAVRADPKDPVAQFQALGDAYLEWAVRYRTEFRLMADSRQIDAMGVPKLRRYLDGLSDLMVRMLQRAVDEGHMHPRENVSMLALSARTFAFGVASMIVDGRFAKLVPEEDQVAMGKALTHDYIRRIARSSTPQPRA
ncbi:MAG: TetR-like C-terminal domain-containing protein [Paracoccus sp. (in: a-proteobacteria)]|nr:TetR-like C-terminal domain-containing protein [Paracoccus sp. (in: a-proteobacteria)]